MLGTDQCVIAEQHFFVRGLVSIPVQESDQPFEWGVWVSLSEENFEAMSAAWEEEGRERAAPMFGWLSSELPVYEPSTLNLKTEVHTQPVGLRPQIQVDDTDHPLAVEQRNGISLARVQDLAERILHQR